MSHVREGEETVGAVLSCEVRAHGEAGKVVRVAFGALYERGEAPAGGQFFDSVFSDCGSVKARHTVAPVGVACQVVEENPHARWHFRCLGAGRVVVNHASKRFAVERSLVNMLLVPPGHVDGVAYNAVGDE